MAGDSLGGLVVKIAGDISELKTAMERSQYLVEQSYNGMIKAGDRLMGSFKAIAITAGAGFAIGGLKAAADQAIETAAAVGRLTEKVGGSAGAWSGIIGAGKAVGASFETMEQGAVRLSRAMSGSEVETKGSSKAFEFLGLKVRDAAGNMKPTEQVMVDIAKALDKYQDGAGKAAIAQDIFGKGGAALLPALKQLAEQGEKNGKITDEMAASAIAYEKDLKRLAATKSELTRTITFAMLPAADAVVNAMTEMAKRTDSVNGAAKALSQDGSLAEWGWNAAKGIAVLVDTMKSAIALAQQLPNAGKIFVDSFVMEGVPLGEQIKSLMMMTDAGKEYNKQILEAKANYKAFLESTQKSMLDLIRLQEQASKALAGRTGPEFWDQRDRELNRPKASASGYTSAGDPKEAKGIDLIAQALKYYGDVLGQINGMEKAYTEGMEKLLLLYNKRIISTQQLTAAEKFLYDTQTKGGQEVARLSLENAKIQDQIDAMKRVGVAMTGAAETAANYAVTYGNLKNLYQAEKDHITDLARKLDLRNKEKAGLEAVAAAQAKLVEEMIREFDQERLIADQITRNNNAMYAQIFAANEQLTNEVNLFGLVGVVREKAIAQIERERDLKLAAMETDEKVAAALINSINKAYDARVKLLDIKDSKSQLAEWSNSLTDAILSAFEAGKGGAQQFLSWLKAEFAKTVLRPVIQTGVNTLFGALGLGAAGSANASTGGGGMLGGIASAFSQLFSNSSGAGAGYGMNDRSLGDNTMAGLFAKYFGDQSTMVSGIGSIAAGIGVGSAVGRMISDALGHGDTHHDHQNIGTVVGSIIGAYWGAAGSMIGGAIGSTVGSIIDSFNEGDIERTARIGTGSRDYTYASKGGKFGDIGIERFSDKGFSDSEMGQTLRVWFDTIGKLDKEVARHFSGDEIRRATAALAGQSTQYSFGMEHSGLDPETLSNIVRERFGTIFGVIDQQMADLVKNFKGSGEDLVTLIVDLSTVHEQLTGLHDSFSTLFGQEIQFGDLAGLKGDTEGYTEALSRLAGEYAVTNQIAEMLGKTQEDVWGAIGLASEGARAHLIDLAGGLDKLAAQLDFYYSHFYTTAEQQAHTLAGLSQSFTDLGETMPTTVDGFRAITDHFLGLGEAGAQASAVLLALAPAFYAYIGAIEAVDVAIKKNADSFRDIFGQDVTTDNFRALQQNGEVLTATLTRVTSEFAATNDILDIFGLSTKTVFGEFGLASEAARAHLIELSGGIQAFSASLASFYQNYFTQGERNQRAMQGLADTFKQLGLTMPTTTQGFRDLVLEQLQLGPAGAAAVAALLGVQQTFFDLFKTLQINGTPLGGLPDAGSLPGSSVGPVLNETVVAAQKAHDALVALNETLTNSFRDAYRSIELAGLSNQQQYEYLQREAAGYVLNLNNATSGEDVQTWAEKIKADMLAAFNLLAPDEQNNRRDEFLANLLKVSDMVTATLARLDPTGALGSSSGAIVPPALAAANSQNLAATTQQAAALLNQQAAEMNVEAAKANLLAAQMIRRVQVQVDPLGLVVEAGA